MTDYQEILRLKSMGYSNRKIGESVRSSHHTVKAVLELAQKYNISYPLDNDMTNADIEKLFYPERKISLIERKEPNFVTRLNLIKVTRNLPSITELQLFPQEYVIRRIKVLLRER